MRLFRLHCLVLSIQVYKNGLLDRCSIQRSVAINAILLAKRGQILSTLCGMASMHSISCVVDVSIYTVTKLLEDAFGACLALPGGNVRNVLASRLRHCLRVRHDEPRPVLRPNERHPLRFQRGAQVVEGAGLRVRAGATLEVSDGGLRNTGEAGKITL